MNKRNAITNAITDITNNFAKKFDMDFSIDSIREIDQLVSESNTLIAEGDTDGLAAALSAFAMYIGEVVRRQHPSAKWLPYNEENGYPLRLSKDVTIFPFNWVAKRIQNGEEDNLCAKVQMIELIVAGKIDISKFKKAA
jgi:hypothetical protein